MDYYPPMITPAGHVAPVPRRVRATLAGANLVDTTNALYVWEWAGYPQYYLPEHDVDPVASSFVARRYERDGRSYVRLPWDAMDAWFEEDEEVFVHPRSPYVRVDALRSGRCVRVELEGVELAESAAPVLVFETGLPTRYYLDRSAVRWEHLVSSLTVTACPYKGRTSAYWSVRVGSQVVADLAWCYDFPTRQLLPIAGLVAFYDEKVDVFIDGKRQDRPVTHFA
jgi:uncharacterized protein (DUF427 family)